MKQDEMIDLVERYFDAVDREDFQAIGATLTDDCVFTVETHGVRLEGLDEIEAMFRRLWADHASVRHRDFVHAAVEGSGDTRAHARPDTSGGRATGQHKGLLGGRHDGGEYHVYRERNSRYDGGVRPAVSRGGGGRHPGPCFLREDGPGECRSA